MVASRKQTVLIRGLTAFALLPLLLSPSCGGPQPRPSEPGPAPVAAPEGPVDPIEIDRVSGSWQWSHAVDSKAVRRVENERWQLGFEGDQLRGQYDREVTFLSLDGNPFECSQTLSYTLRTRYELRGSAHARHLIIEELDYQTRPSPCDGGFRKMGRYEGFLQDGKLLLIWNGGSQTLSRAKEPGPEAEQLAASAELEVEGRWSWHNASRPSAEGEVRVEREDWVIDEEPDGRVVASYLRKVTVYDQQGRTYDCAGASQYEYTDRYTLAGRRRGTRLVLTEVQVDPGEHACLTHSRRHLDEAVGSLNGDYLELVWRGGHRQVLHRPVEPRELSGSSAEGTAAIEK